MPSLPVREAKRVFLVVWFGQLISAIGTDLSGFAMGVFVFQRTGSVTQFAMMAVFTRIPSIVLSPFAGALADRWDRRRVMLVGNAISGATLLLIALLAHRDVLAVWQLYVAVAVVAMCGAFRDPAYYATVGQLVPKKQHGRATGMVQTGENVALVAPPLVAGALVLAMGLPGVLLIDFLTYVVGIVAILMVRFPAVPSAPDRKPGGSSMWRDTVAGWNYVMDNRGLLFLFLVGAATSFSVGMTQIAVTPLVLGFASAATLGGIFSVGGLAMLLGGAAMTAWGGPKRRVVGIFTFGVAQSISLIVIGLRPSAILIGLGIFGLLFSIQFVRGCTTAIILTHVPADKQARVFALNRAVAWSTLPLSYLLAGPLVKGVFEPLLAESGALAGSVGRLIGVGPGRGIGLLLVTLSLAYLLVVVTSYANPRMRNVESDMRHEEAALGDAEPELQS
jgi:MFS transporter, DHA3 family, macrolide efflux protein